MGPSETKKALVPGREIIRCGGDGGRGTPHPALRATFPPGGRLWGVPFSNTDPARGRLEGFVIQRREAIKGKAWRLRAGVQRKFTVFLQNLKVELRKASML